MDDTLYGTRNQRGEWSPKPARRVRAAVRLAAREGAARWLGAGYPGYILPFNLLYALVAITAWFVATPSPRHDVVVEPWMDHRGVRLATRPC